MSHYINVGHISIPIYATASPTVEYGPRWRAVCNLKGDDVVLGQIEAAGEWQRGL